MEALESELLGTLERAEVLIVQQQAKMKQLEQKLHDLVATNTEDDAAKDATAKLRERVAALEEELWAKEEELAATEQGALLIEEENALLRAELGAARP